MGRYQPGLLGLELVSEVILWSLPHYSLRPKHRSSVLGVGKKPQGRIWVLFQLTGFHAPSGRLRGLVNHS